MLREKRTVDAVSQVAQLLGVVQHLDALGVGVVAHAERSGDGGCKFPAAQTRFYQPLKKTFVRRVRCVNVHG